MSKFDNDIQPGDLITAYHAGFHRATKVERRFVTKADEKLYEGRHGKAGDEYMSFISYTPVLTANYQEAKGKKEKGCDASYCERLTKEAIEARRKKLLQEINDGHDLLLKNV